MSDIYELVLVVISACIFGFAVGYWIGFVIYLDRREKR